MGSDTCATRQHGSMSWDPPKQPNFDPLVSNRDNASGSGPLRAEQTVGASTGNWRHSSIEHNTANGNAGTVATAMSQRVGPYEAAGAGAARQFKKALFSSRACPSPVASGLSAAHQAPEPDYGDYADYSSDYGMHVSCPGKGHYSSRRIGSSSYNQARPAAATTRQPANGQQQLQTSRPSGSVSRTIHTGPPALTLRQQSGSGTGARTDTHAAGQQQQQQHCGLKTTHKELRTPDYGVYGDSDDYGADLKGSRRSRAPHSRPQHPRKRSERQQHAGNLPESSAERQAVEAELAALRAALEEAEARQVEAQLAVITLETDNTTLQAQLQGMRQQKQQLEMMLLFGDNHTLDCEVCSSDGSTSSLNKESPVAEQLTK